MVRKTTRPDEVIENNSHQNDAMYDNMVNLQQQTINDKSQARLAVLEKIAEVHERRITDIEDFHRSVVERFDQKIQLDAANQVAMEKTMAKAVTTLEALSTNLETALTLANEASKLASKHETIGVTLIKGGGVGAVIIAAIWAVFKFFFLPGV